MNQHPLRTLIETCDAAISRRDFDALMAFYAEDADGQWRCTIDNSYGTALLDSELTLATAR